MNVVQKVEQFLGNYPRVLANPPEWYSRENFEVTTHVLPYLKTADYYEIESSIAEVASEEAQNYLTSWFEFDDGSDELFDDELRMPEDARSPSNETVLFVPYANQQDMVYLILKEDDEYDSHNVFVLLNQGALFAGGYVMKPYGQTVDGKPAVPLFFPKNTEEKMQLYEYRDLILIAAFMCDLINQPRFVIQSPAATRQQRKYMMRARKIPTGAWKKIEWNIAEPVYAPNETKQGGWNMPLHYKRGHWRKAEAHWDDVVIRKDGKPYKWIEGYWAGHPAYGVQRSYHAPKLGKNHEAIYA